jgi:RecB family endonuclease NucS
MRPPVILGWPDAVARRACPVNYSGRLNAVLAESVRLIIVKADGSVLVHADAGGYKPLNC